MGMSDSISYGKLTKRIVFTDTDHRHAQLLLKLKNDNLNQSDFFRILITGYIEDNNSIREYIDMHAPLSIKKKQKSQKLRQTGTTKIEDLGLSAKDVDSIFDLIEKEHPEL
jgi:hypothetical protein